MIVVIVIIVITLMIVIIVMIAIIVIIVITLITREKDGATAAGMGRPHIGGEDDAVGNPHRAQISQFEFFELILLLKLDKQFPVEQFEATVSQSTVPSPPLSYSLRQGKRGNGF